MARYVETSRDQFPVPVENICAGFSESVNDSLTSKAVAACVEFGCDTIVVGGGYSANSRLRELLVERAAKSWGKRSYTSASFLY